MNNAFVWPADGGMPLFGRRQDEVHAQESSAAGYCVRDLGGPEPQGLASLLAMRHAKHQGVALVSHSVTFNDQGISEFHLPPVAVRATMTRFAATEGEVGKADAISQQGDIGQAGDVVSHAVSPGSTNYQPPSPQLREGTSPAKRARAHARQVAYGRLLGYPVADMGGISDGATPLLLSHTDDTQPSQADPPDKAVAELRFALAAAESTARIAAWSQDATWPRSAPSNPADASEVAAAEAHSSPASWHLRHAIVSVGKAGVAGSWESESRSCGVPVADVSESSAAAGFASSVKHSEYARQLSSNNLAFPLADNIVDRRLDNDTSHQSPVIDGITPPKAPDQAVMELQARLLSHAAAVAAAERRAELAERKQAESHSLLLSLQDALMQSAISGSAAATPVSSPPGGSSGGSVHIHAQSAPQATSLSSSPIGVKTSRGAHALARGVAAEAAAVSRDATRDAAARAQADAATIARLEAQLQDIRLERDTALEAAKQAALREVPKGLGQLWEQLLVAEAEANMARNGSSSSGCEYSAQHTRGAAALVSSPKELVGEIWEQLRASYSEREALKRSASHAEAQLQHYRRATYVSSPPGVTGNLSRAFSAAADRAKSVEQGTAEPISSPHGENCSHSSSRSRTSAMQVAPSPFAIRIEASDVGGSPVLESPPGKNSRGALCSRSVVPSYHSSLAGQDVVSPFESPDRYRSPCSPSLKLSPLGQRSRGMPSSPCPPLAPDRPDVSESDVTCGGSSARPQMQPVASLAEVPTTSGTEEGPESPAGGYQAVMRRLPPLVAVALTHAAAFPRRLSWALQPAAPPSLMAICACDERPHAERDVSASSQASSTQLKLVESIAPGGGIGNDNRSSSEANNCSATCSAKGITIVKEPCSDTRCDPSQRQYLGPLPTSPRVNANAAEIYAATARTSSARQLFPCDDTCTQRALVLTEATLLDSATSGDVLDQVSGTVAEGGDAVACNRWSLATWQLPEAASSLLRPETPMQQVTAAGIVVTIAGVIAAWYHVSSRRRRFMAPFWM